MNSNTLTLHHQFLSNLSSNYFNYLAKLPDPIIGGSIGGKDALLLHPLMMLNNILQRRADLVASKSSISAEDMRINPRNLYKGVHLTFMTMTMAFMIQYSVAKKLETALYRAEQQISSEQPTLNKTRKFISTFTAGAISGILVNSVENIQVNWIEQQKNSVPRIAMRAVAKQMYDKKGINSIWQPGAIATMVRFGTGAFSFMMMAPYLRETYGTDSPWSNIASCASAGFFSAVVTHPPDRIRNYQQRVNPQASLREAARAIITNEGSVSFFTTGLIGARLWRVGLSVALGAYVNDQVSQVRQNNLSR